MSMTGISAIDQVSAALSLASLRHETIASNIANRDAQGYQRLQVRFDEAMQRGQIVPAPADPADPQPSIEQDAVALSTNTAQYEALARVLSRYFSILGAITNYSRS
jgi:flagellar basal body rod protein FlgB